MDGVVQVVLAAVAAGAVVWIITDRQRLADRLNELSKQLEIQGKKLEEQIKENGDQAQEIAGLKATIANYEASRGQLFAESILDREARHKRVFRLLEVGLGDILDAVHQESPAMMRRLIKRLDIK
jgi:hypothetical protein